MACLTRQRLAWRGTEPVVPRFGCDQPDEFGCRHLAHPPDTLTGSQREETGVPTVCRRLA